MLKFNQYEVYFIMAGIAARLPQVSGDDGAWGTVLNNFLAQSLVNVTTGATTSAQNGYLTQIRLITYASSPATLTPNPGQTALVDSTNGAVSIVLPDATATYNIYNIKKTDSSTNTVTINTTSSQKIDDSISVVIQVQYTCVSVVSDGTKWHII
jgi:hypothetical protein